MKSESVNAAPEIAGLFAANVIAYQTREHLSSDTLLPEERPFVQRAAPKRIQEFSAGRACARAALADLGFADTALPMGADRAPVWPPGVTGSITHTDGFCAAVVATATEVRALGLDAEVADSVRPHLWPRICGPGEHAILQSLDSETAIAIATLMFSAKEAFYKCQHLLTGQWLGFLDIAISIDAEGFTVRPSRALQIEAVAAGPWRGRYLQEAGTVMTGVCII